MRVSAHSDTKRQASLLSCCCPTLVGAFVMPHATEAKQGHTANTGNRQACYATK